MTAAVTERKDKEIFRQEVGELFEKYAPMLFCAAKSIIGNHADAEDALQNAFVQLLDRPPSVDFDKNPQGFLYRAVVNEALDFLKCRKRKNLVDEDITELEITVFAEDETTLQREDMDQQLTLARSKLDPYLSVLLTLRYELNYSCEEIARMFRRTRTGIFLTIRRAERLLQTMMLPPGETR